MSHRASPTSSTGPESSSDTPLIEPTTPYAKSWLEVGKPFDQVHATPESIRQFETTYHPIQPYQHAYEHAFPPFASRFGLVQYVYKKDGPQISKPVRGIGCNLHRKTQGQCHKNGYLPAFLYTHPTLKCTLATAAGQETLHCQFIHKPADDKSVEHLVTQACWYCVTSIKTGCSSKTFILNLLDESDNPPPPEDPSNAAVDPPPPNDSSSGSLMDPPQSTSSDNPAPETPRTQISNPNTLKRSSPSSPTPKQPHGKKTRPNTASVTPDPESWLNRMNKKREASVEVSEPGPSTRQNPILPPTGQPSPTPSARSNIHPPMSSPPGPQLHQVKDTAEQLRGLFSAVDDNQRSLERSMGALLASATSEIKNASAFLRDKQKQINPLLNQFVAQHGAAISTASNTTGQLAQLRKSLTYAETRAANSGEAERQSRLNLAKAGQSLADMSAKKDADIRRVKEEAEDLQRRLDSAVLDRDSAVIRAESLEANHKRLQAEMDEAIGVVTEANRKLKETVRLRDLVLSHLGYDPEVADWSSGSWNLIAAQLIRTQDRTRTPSQEPPQEERPKETVLIRLENPVLTETKPTEPVNEVPQEQRVGSLPTVDVKDVEGEDELDLDDEKQEEDEESEDKADTDIVS
ncbi:hypothetical protein P7C73_g8, partial [Tremellales sp. Uapishka_1]